MRKLLILFLILNACSFHKDKRPQPDSELEQINKQVTALEGTVGMLDAFVSSDFTNCNADLPIFERKICRIAQTATAEQRAEFAGQISEVAKIFQNQIYGENCIDNTTPGCPVAGSILYDLHAVQAQTEANSSDIVMLQASVLNIQGDLSAINTRLNNFNGSGSSIETVISGLQNDIDNLINRVEAIEDTLNENAILATISLCNDNADSGPVFETVLTNGVKTNIIAYIRASGKSGLGTLKSYGDGNGDKYLSTLLNTKTCKFKIYEYDGALKICWKNTDRSVSEVALDLACDAANGFAAPSSTCTCK